MSNLIEFILDRKIEIFHRTIEHIQMIGISVFLAVFVGIPLGIILTRIKKLILPVVGIVNIIQTIPSLALLGLLIPLMGIGIKPAILALFLYSLLAIIKNTIAGINQIDSSLIEAGLGVGMTDRQILFKVELPLAVPIILSGIRIATVTCIGIATLCAAIGAGGLGQFIFRGISMLNNNMILCGALPAALLALILDFLLYKFEKYLTPEINYIRN
ncbi:MAG: ABC transporter permease [Thermodesulfobacteriota bacterium]|nr:ABC transporter permease [Thermodesulfobacteriota bacterium]